MGRRGSVLVLALWSVVVLALLASALAYSVQQKITAFRRLSARQETRLMTESLVRKLLSEFAVHAEASHGTRNAWMDARLDVPLQFPVGRGSVDFRIEDESRKLNVNSAPDYVLKRLFRSVAGLEEDAANRLAWAVVDFRDADDHLSMIFDQGSEKDAYARAGLAHGPKNAPLEQASELQLVKGMTKEIYSLVRNYITIYGNGQVNVNRCDKEMLAMIEMPSELADKILAVRNGPDGLYGTGDDKVFGGASQLADELNAAAPLTDGERTFLQHAFSHALLGVTSAYFKITAEARLDRPRSSSKTVCVFHPESGIRFWAER